MSKLYIGNELIIDPSVKLERIELTLAEYNALSEKKDNVLYVITDSVNPLEVINQKLSDNENAIANILSTKGGDYIPRIQDSNYREILITNVPGNLTELEVIQNIVSGKYLNLLYDYWSDYLNMYPDYTVMFSLQNNDPLTYLGINCEGNVNFYKLSNWEIINNKLSFEVKETSGELLTYDDRKNLNNMPKIKLITEEDYNALENKDNNTLYCIPE